MPVGPYVPGIPGLRSAKTAQHYVVFKGGYIPEVLPQGKLIDGSKARDIGNTPITSLRPGMLMGKITSSGLYAPSIMDVLASASLASATSLTISAAGAAELVRRIGTSGTFQLQGPSTASGTNHSETVTYSAVNTSTGVITCSATTNAYVAGSWIQGLDGSQTILTFIPDGYPIPVVDNDGVTNLTVQFPELPVAGIIIAANLLFWNSTDTTLQGLVVTALNVAGTGRFTFDYKY